MTDIEPILVGPDYRIRPLVENDRDSLFLVARDPLIWEQHPARTRHQRNVFDDYFTSLTATPGSVGFEVKQSGRLVGCSRFYRAPDAPDEWAIGFTFIERALWGGAANFALKTMMLDHLFTTEDVSGSISTKTISARRREQQSLVLCRQATAGAIRWAQARCNIFSVSFSHAGIGSV